MPKSITVTVTSLFGFRQYDRRVKIKICIQAVFDKALMRGESFWIGEGCTEIEEIGDVSRLVH